MNESLLTIEKGKSMLILTRRIGEKIMIGEDTNFTVLGIKGNQVRFGIDAPEHVIVHREEIYKRVKASQQEKNSRTAVYNSLMMAYLSGKEKSNSLELIPKQRNQ